jgi:hypothetical protein
VHNPTEAPTTTPLPPTDNAADQCVAEATRFLRLLQPAGNVFEIRLLNSTGRSNRTDSGFFDDADKAAGVATCYDGVRRPKGTYVTLNPLKPAILARCANRLEQYVKSTAADADVERRRWIIIDVDPRRDGGVTDIMATESEIRAAWDVAEEARNWLCGEMAWSEPAEFDSGNGRYLLFPMDLPNDAESAELVRRVLLAIEQRVGKPEAHIDLTMFNASRIIRVMGTTNRKGDSIGERVHRVAKISHIPEYLKDGLAEPIPVERLKAVAALARDDQKTRSKATFTNSAAGPTRNGHASNSHATPNCARRLNMPRYLTARGIPFTAKSDGGFDVTCVNHDDHIASFHQAEDGTPGYHCFHNRCAGFDWAQASEKIGKPNDDDYDRNPKDLQAVAGTDLSSLPWVPSEGEWVRAKDRGNYGQVTCVSAGTVTVHFTNPDDGNTFEGEFPVSDLEPHRGRSNAPQKPILKFTARTMAEKDPKLDDPVIDGLLRTREVMNIISVSKIGKSWLLYYILLCIVTGRSIFDRFATTAGRVLLIDNELPPSLLPFRIKTVAEAMAIQPQEYLDKFDIWSLRHSPRSIFELGTEFAGVAPATYMLIALDAKYKSLGPDAEENSNSDEARYFAEVGVLAEMTGSAWSLTHHSTKGNQSDKRIVDVGAGGSSQARAADTHLVLREHEDDDAVVLAGAVRSFAPFDPLGLRWDFPLWSADENLDVKQLKGKKSEHEENQSKLDQEADGAILDVCQTWRTRSEIRKETGLGDMRRDRAIFRLLKAKFLEAGHEDRPRHPKSEVFRKTLNAR